MKTASTHRKQLHAPIFLGAAILLLGGMVSFRAQSQFQQNSLEGASALKPAQMEISLYGGGNYYSNDNGHGDWGYIPGLKVGIGVVKNFDIKVSYSRGFYNFTDKLEDSKENNICVMPKISFLNEHIAFQLPFSVTLYNLEYYGETKLETAYMLQPRLIGTYRVGQYFEVSLSPVLDIMMADGREPLWWLGGNLGVAASSNLNRWSIRPEGYINFCISDNPYNMKFYGWGLAFTYNIDFKKNQGSEK